MLRGEIVRFLVAGGINTAITYALYLVLLPLGYEVAYAIAYAAGIVISYLLNARFVFRTPLRFRDFLKFPLIYVVQYATGALALWLLVEHGGIAEEWALLGVIAMTIPLIFVLSRYALVSGRS
jgi:putative flippase GtrA